MTITVHHLQFSQSFRMIWLMEALGADYDLKIYPRDPETNLAPADYKALSPLGTAPVITDGDTVVGESNTTIDYVMDRHPDSPLRPAPGDPNRDAYLFWFHAGQGSWMPMLFIDMVFTMLTMRSPFFLRPLLKPVFGKARELLVQPRLNALFTAAEAQLAKTTWLGGDHLTAADISMSYTMAATRERGFINENHPGCMRWLQQMAADPAFQRAKAKDDGRNMLFTF